MLTTTTLVLTIMMTIRDPVFDLLSMMMMMMMMMTLVLSMTLMLMIMTMAGIVDDDSDNWC